MYYIPGAAEGRSIGQIKIGDFIQIHACPESCGQQVYATYRPHFPNGLRPQELSRGTVGNQFDSQFFCPRHGSRNGIAPYDGACRMIPAGGGFHLIKTRCGNLQIKEFEGLRPHDARENRFVAAYIAPEGAPLLVGNIPKGMCTQRRLTR